MSTSGPVQKVVRNACVLHGTARARAGDIFAGGRQAFLAADVGGTHARLGLVGFGPGRDEPSVLASCVYRCADHPGLDAIVRAFCEQFAIRPHSLVLACAGFLHEGRMVNSNLSWPIVPSILEQALALDEVCVLNDFEALAHATAHIGRDGAMPLHTPQPSGERAAGPVVIVGPGTGLGSAVRLPGPSPRVLATEAGHVQLAARAGREQQVLCELAASDTHVPCEQVLSGPGLLRLYRALCGIERKPVVFDQPAAVSAAACAGGDGLAIEALQLFCGWLGSFAGDLAMLYGASGGVYLAGGFLSQMIGFMRGSTFVARFLDKGVMRPFLQTVPVQVVDHGLLGVIGAASWMMERHGATLPARLA